MPQGAGRAKQPKGKPVNILVPRSGAFKKSGNATELGDAGRSLEKSLLFFLTDHHRGIELIGEAVCGLEKWDAFAVPFEALLTVREKPRESSLHWWSY